jgi:hypothetical protein
MRPIVKLKPFAATLALAALAATGCARTVAAGGTPSLTPFSGLVLRVDVGGGLLAPQAQLRQLPMFALYADGRLIIPGPQIEIYPGPALPNLQVRTVRHDAIAAILAAARDAGLLGPDRQFTAIPVADAPTTTFTVVADGVRHVVAARALGFDQGTPGVSEDEARARAKLAAFEAKLTDLQSWLPAGSLGSERPFRTDELRVYALPYQAQQDLMQKPKDWPLGSRRRAAPCPGVPPPSARRVRLSVALQTATSASRRWICVASPLGSCRFEGVVAGWAAVHRVSPRTHPLIPKEDP